MRRIDFKTGIMFVIATLPGTIIGTYLTANVSRMLFNIVFGSFLFIFAAVILLKSKLGNASAQYDKPGLFRARRIFTDSDGSQTAFSFNLLAGIMISVAVGFLSGFLGIGGGIVHVPALIFLGFPAHFATATSHFVVAFSSFSSVLVHLANGALSHDIAMALCIAGGAVVGAQIGARISKRVKGSGLMICLAIALILSGLRILLTGLLS